MSRSRAGACSAYAWRRLGPPRRATDLPGLAHADCDEGLIAPPLHGRRHVVRNQPERPEGRKQGARHYWNIAEVDGICGLRGGGQRVKKWLRPHDGRRRARWQHIAPFKAL